MNRYFLDLAVAMSQAAIDYTSVVVGDALDDGPRVVAANAGAQGLMRRVVRVARVSRPAIVSADILDVHFAVYGLLPALIARRRGTPLVVHFHGPWSAESRAAGENALVVHGKRIMEGTLYRMAARCVVLSRAFGQVLVEQFGVAADKVVVIPPGVDLDRFVPDYVAARRLWRLPNDSFVAVSARRLESRMGLDVLLEAWQLVESVMHDPRLIIAGDGSQRSALEARVQEMRLRGVKFVGRIDDANLVRLYQAATCSVVPSRALEGFGLVTLESLACGTPPVVTDVGGLPDAVRGLDQSLVVPPEDPSALAARIISAARGDLPGREACRAHAQHFTWAQAVAEHATLYGRVGR